MSLRTSMGNRRGVPSDKYARFPSVRVTRFPELELNILLQRLIVTDDARGASEELSREWTPLTPAQILDTPSLLIGTLDTIAESVRERRERLGISYIVVFERDMEAFAPVVARLAGT